MIYRFDFPDKRIIGCFRWPWNPKDDISCIYRAHSQIYPPLEPGKNWSLHDIS
jgi:hypothetical protein